MKAGDRLRKAGGARDLRDGATARVIRLLCLGFNEFEFYMKKTPVIPIMKLRSLS